VNSCFIAENQINTVAALNMSEKELHKLQLYMLCRSTS